MKTALFVFAVFIGVFLLVCFMGEFLHFGGAAEDPNDEGQKEFVMREAEERQRKRELKNAGHR